MKIVLSSRAAKQLNRMNEPLKGRIKMAISMLPQGDIKKLEGRQGFRLRVGGFRVLFGMQHDTIVVTDILPRGQAYKGG